MTTLSAPHAASSERIGAAKSPAASLSRRGETLPFAKFEGAGNDFVIVDARSGAWPRDWAALARRLCDRHFGIGADGLLLAVPPEAAGALERMRMFNPDGSESEMCGNGLRCFVRWLVERGDAPNGDLPVETGAGVLVAQVHGDGSIAVDMGYPRFAPAEIPLSPEAAAGQPENGPVLHLPLPLPEGAGAAGSRSLDVTCVSMGNPHAVCFMDAAQAVMLEVLGPTVERHPAFPARTNFEVCQVIARDRLRVRVWERGAGLTLACGTGACAAVVAARLRGLVDERVDVELPGGLLHVVWSGQTVQLSGPAQHVFDGQWQLP
jgi:diaminopimelate epimerase